MTTLESISWSDFKRFKILGIFLKKLIIYGKNKNISFDLHVFNKEQQKEIISELEYRDTQL
ncbi:hypothetical protein [Shewanella baltica]|uniref:hypothetical protein n=1 Tax=Shewanella baltica TaxID=62322 RepID=UPI000E1C357D|nr:hypothetical protein [Shewanella baltica]